MAAMLLQRELGIMRTLSTYWLNKGLALIAAALLVGLTLTQIARYAIRGTHGAEDHGGVRVMGRGGQFEMPPLW